MLSLVKTFCIPLLLFGVESCDINLTERTRIDNCFKSVFNKLFCTYSKEIIKSCQYYTGCLPLNYLIDQRTLCFRRNLHDFQGINSVVYFCFLWRLKSLMFVPANIILILKIVNTASKIKYGIILNYLSIHNSYYCHCIIFLLCICIHGI